MTAIHVGQAVTDSEGHIGIVSDYIRKSGPNKGKVGVMWVGGRYEVSEDPEDLTPVTLMTIP